MPSATEPVVILVEPQLPENIGATARAMGNFGLSRLRLVRPNGGWPNERAVPAASGAEDILAAATAFDDVRSAIADLRFVFATTARAREAVKPIRGPQEAAVMLRALAVAGSVAGILFGRERTGLTNEEVSLADEILTLPVAPAHASLNIAQAVLIVAYEWRRSGRAPDQGEGLPFTDGSGEPPAERGELLRLFEHLEAALEETGFFRPAEKRPHMVFSLRAMLQRASLTKQEVRTLRGVVAALEDRPTRPYVAADGTMTTRRGPSK